MTYKQLSIADKCLVHRYLYYVKAEPVISDFEYDVMERQALNHKKTAPDHDIREVGSSLESSYTFEIREAADELLTNQGLL